MQNRTIRICIYILIGIVITFHLGMKKEPDPTEVEDIASHIAKARWWQGKYPPDFELELLNGEKFLLSDHIGKEVIILNFFSTRCGPCRDEMPELLSYYQKHRSEGMIMVGIDTDEDEGMVNAFVRQNKIDFPVGIDRGDIIRDEYAIDAFPTTVFIGIDGRIGIYQVGAISNSEVTFEPLYTTNVALLKENGGIDRETYLACLKKQPSPPKEESQTDSPIVLEGKAQEFGSRMVCPSCGKSLLRCRCDFCDDIKKKLQGMQLDGKTDEKVLTELFLEAKPKR